MAVLMYRDEDDWPREHTFTEETRIGSDSSVNDLVLPAARGVAPEHAVIWRATLGRLPVLVDVAGAGTHVNGRPVIYVKILRQGDMIAIGDASLTFWEVRAVRLEASSPLTERPCPVCTVPFSAGDEVLSCPRCRTVHHWDCWFSIPLCSYYGCEYPIHGSVVDALSPWVSFELRLAESSSLVREQVSCSAGNRRDRVPFQMGDSAAFCPSCSTPFHLTCWLLMQDCSVCEHEVRLLIERVFGAVSPAMPADKRGQQL